MAKSKIDINKLISDIIDLKVGLDPKYFRVQDLPALKAKIDKVAELLPDLTSSYKAFHKIGIFADSLQKKENE